MELLAVPSTVFTVPLLRDRVVYRILYYERLIVSDWEYCIGALIKFGHSGGEFQSDRWNGARSWSTERWSNGVFFRSRSGAGAQKIFTAPVLQIFFIISILLRTDE